MNNTNVEVLKSGSESSTSLIRKFSRRVQGAGVIPTVRGARYHSRNKSKTVKKKQALKRIGRRETIQKLIKEGKMTEAVPRRGGPNQNSSQSNQSATRDNTSRNTGAETAAR